LQLLAPEQFQPLLTTPEHRAELLLRAGADQVIVLHTTHELLQVTARDYYQQILRDRLRVTGIVEGFNFRFGHNRLGDNPSLRAWCASDGLAFREVAPFRWNGVPVSSSQVRTALQEGDVAKATDLLNRPYRVAGSVGTGARRGRTIGFPTANLENVETLVPAEGVYAVRGSVGDTTYAAAANIGPNPTFGEDARKIEVHLIGFTGDLYGKTLVVDFLARLRPTQRFASVDELVAQLRRDVDRAREVCGAQ
jgi:riboflavin kinase/FMN adenylyltransferase